MSRTPLDQSEIDAALIDLPDWAHKEDALVKTFMFGSFREATSFFVRLAFEAEERDHHPEVTNVYNRVTVKLCTHDAGNRVTESDVSLARAIESFAWR